MLRPSCETDQVFFRVRVTTICSKHVAPPEAALKRRCPSLFRNKPKGIDQQSLEVMVLARVVTSGGWCQRHQAH
jgi:hypothetical protein